MLSAVFTNVGRIFFFTLQTDSMSEIAFRPMLAATMMSSCLQLFPAATALAVANVIGLVQRTSISGVPVELVYSRERTA
jgi:hypothetical protein